MLFSNAETVQAEVSYRQERIARDFRWANRRREAKRAAEQADEQAVLLAAARLAAEAEHRLTAIRPAA